MSDWLAAGHTCDELVDLACATEMWKPNERPPSEAATTDGVINRQHKRRLLDWNELAARTPPPRAWAVNEWLPQGEITLKSGRGGIGKSILMQHMSTAMARGVDYIGRIENPLRVLDWYAEDAEPEIWRRQIPIAKHFNCGLSDLADQLFVESFADRDATLAYISYGQLVPTPLMEELRTQVLDYKAAYVFLDNIARLYGGSENDRHQVTQFVAWLRAACAPAGICLLGHPAKATGSEYSGSTAWEGAVRSRLWLTDRPPGADQSEEDVGPDQNVRYLSRRKANYASANDVRRFTLIDGVLIPAAVVAAQAGSVSGDFAKDMVRRAVRALAERNTHGNMSTRSPDYLPRLAKSYGLLDTLSEKQFGRYLREMVMAGEITSQPVGQYSNRTPRLGLVLPP